MATDQNEIGYPERHRLELDSMFRELLGNNNVYFAPPESIKLKFPCIVYERVNSQVFFANNKPYKNDTRYLATVITEDPDTDVPDKLAAKEKCTWDRTYVVDNLYHYAFTVY